MRPEQHPASNSNARKAHAEATDQHGGCEVGTCKAEDQWRTVSCAGGGGDVGALPRILSVPSEEAMQHLLDALNVSGLHPEVACGYLTGGVTFLAGLSGPDADHVHITVTEADNGVVHCCECAHPGERANEWDPNSWRPTYPVLALVTEWPDLARVVEEGFIDPWWTAALAAQPAAPQPTEGGEVAARHQILAGSHERPNGAECLCGADWDRWNNCCAAPLQRPEGVTVTEALLDGSRDSTTGALGEAPGEPLEFKARELTALAYLVVTCEALGIEIGEEWDRFMYARAIHRRVRAILTTFGPCVHVWGSPMPPDDPANDANILRCCTLCEATEWVSRTEVSGDTEAGGDQ